MNISYFSGDTDTFHTDSLSDGFGVILGKRSELCYHLVRLKLSGKNFHLKTDFIQVLILQI